MKKVVMGVVLVALVSMVSVAASRAVAEEKSSVSGSKIGYVDLNRALNEVAEGKSAKAKLEADGKVKKAKLESMQGDLRKMKEEYDKQKLILSADALKQKESQMQQKIMELQKTMMEYEQEFAKKEADAIKPISDKLQATIQRIGQSDGYLLIVPREMALYAPNGTDLTDKVISSYGKK